jgi:hypothetical protein
MESSTSPKTSEPAATKPSFSWAAVAKGTRGVTADVTRSKDIPEAASAPPAAPSSTPDTPVDAVSTSAVPAAPAAGSSAVSEKTAGVAGVPDVPPAAPKEAAVAVAAAAKPAWKKPATSGGDVQPVAVAANETFWPSLTDAPKSGATQPAASSTPGTHDGASDAQTGGHALGASKVRHPSCCHTEIEYTLSRQQSTRCSMCLPSHWRFWRASSHH